MRKHSWLLLFLLSACAVQAPPPRAAEPAAPRTVTVMTHDSFSASESVIAEFERAHNAKVVVLKSGDAGSTLNKAILSKDAPLADVIYGVDNTFLGRALAADILEPYNAPALAAIPDRFKLDPQNRLLPVDYGHVMVNYDKAFLEAKGLMPPTSLRALTEPQWKGSLVVENPATSSPGLAFLLATIAAFPEGSAYDWRQFWRDLRANDVYVSPDWSDAYYNQFSGSSGKGPRPLVVSYATSPAAEVFFSEGKLQAPPTGNVEGTAFEQIEFVGILKGTKNRDLAEKWVDFMLSKRFQEDIPLQMFVYPVLPEAALPEVFVKFGQPPAQFFTLSTAEIDRGRERWIEEWERIVVK
jgi:thiamine transport system substrate-binding protein